MNSKTLEETFPTTPIAIDRNDGEGSSREHAAMEFPTTPIANDRKTNILKGKAVKIYGFSTTPIANDRKSEIITTDHLMGANDVFPTKPIVNDRKPFQLSIAHSTSGLSFQLSRSRTTENISPLLDGLFTAVPLFPTKPIANDRKLQRQSGCS
ncbi:hypothetical protein [Romeriopsis navalis]|uniref:hypothetical protein n=1 Tax=Romeriopsis navalis TaxID=2992132 RepID=UPI0038702E49